MDLDKIKKFIAPYKTIEEYQAAWEELDDERKAKIEQLENDFTVLSTERDIEMKRARISEKEIERLHKQLGTIAITFKPDEYGLMQPVFDASTSALNLRICEKLHEKINGLEEQCAGNRVVIEELQRQLSYAEQIIKDNAH